MAFLWRSLALSIVFMVVVAVSFVQSSRTSIQIERVHHLAAKATQGVEMPMTKKSSRNESSAIYGEDSAREVPTGPNPLHHNGNPTRP